MAEQDEQQQDDRTEEATPERREEFREKGQIAVSREISSVVVLVAVVGFLIIFWPTAVNQMQRIFITNFQSAATLRIDRVNFLGYLMKVWLDMLAIIVPISIAAMVAACGTTFLQTRFNWSWKRLKPDFSRLNVLKGMTRMVNTQAMVELGKGIGKMGAVGVVSYLILKSEWYKVPGLMNMAVPATWAYWGDITSSLLWSVSALLLFIGLLDYFYNFMSLERKLRMTKQEVKEEFKRRELDPHLKARIRRIQRDMAMRKVIEGTQKATVVITNPTHYAVALQYEIGMPAPLVVAKGIDHLALRMREVAKEFDIPIVENKALARTLYKIVEVDQEIPESLYRAVSEIIRFAFKLKGISLTKRSA